MGPPDAEEPGGFDLIQNPRSVAQRRPSELVSEAIRRDLLTLADLPGQEVVRFTFRRELFDVLKAS